MIRSLTWTACLVAAALLAGPALAEPPPTRLEIKLGAYAPRLNTQVRLDSSTGDFGAQVDFEEDFGLDDVQLSVLLGVHWQIKKKHGLFVEYFDLQRDSQGQSTISLRFGDEVFPADVPLAVSFETRVLAVSYVYRFFNNKQRSFGLNFGLNVNELKASMAVVGGPDPISESSEVTAPLPTIGVHGHVMLSRKWKFFGTIGVFAASVGDHEGLLTGAVTGFTHETFKHVGFGIGYTGFKIRIESEDEDFLGKIKVSYGGVNAYVSFRLGGAG